jgi:sec-independent protein translocase protein TatB
MPGFGDSAFLILLALLLFGPKKLPVLARQLGKLMADFRRASNEFRTQMEEELRISEQAERQKQVAAIEAAAPPSPAIDTPHEPPPAPSFTSTSESDSPYMVDSPDDPPAPPSPDPALATVAPDPAAPYSTTAPEPAAAPPEPAAAPVPIATSGDLSIRPPATGLPIAAGSPNPANVPVAPSHDPAATHEGELETETLHG